MNINQSQIKINLQDEEWAFEYTDHDREIVRAIVFDDDGYLYFVRAERDDDFGKATLIETAGGGVESGEDLHTAIIRELKEEIGAVGKDYRFLGELYPSAGYCAEIIYLYFCRIESIGDNCLDEGEFLNREVIHIDKAVEMVLNNEIKDSNTQTAVLKTAMLLKNGIL